MRVPVLPVFICLGPAAALIGFVLVMMGISSRQPRMWKFGVGVLSFDALMVLVYLGLVWFKAR